MKIQWSKEKWIVTSGAGLIVGAGDRITHKLQCSETVRRVAMATSERVTEPLSLESLVGELSQVFPAAIVRETVQVLIRVGVLGEAQNQENRSSSDPDQHPLHAYLKRSYGQEVAFAKFTRVQEARIGVVGDGPLAKGIHGALLSGSPAKVESIGTENLDSLTRSHFDLVIATAQDDLQRHQLFPRINRSLLETKTPWLAVSLRDSLIQLGPLFIPEETACYRCYELREESNLPNLADFRLVKEVSGRIQKRDTSAIPAFVIESAAQMIAAEAIRTVAREILPATYQTLVEIDLRSFESERHALLKVPLCDECGSHVKTPFRRFWS